MYFGGGLHSFQLSVYKLKKEQEIQHKSLMPE